MSWVTHFLTSSVGRKLLMALTGLFLCLFLVIHMAGNMQLLFGDGGVAFNKYAKDMTTNPLIMVVSYFTYFTILLHAIDGIWIAYQNKKARPIKYAAPSAATNSSWASRNMALLGSLIFLFLVIHLKSFWFEYKFGTVPMVDIDGTQYKDLYSVVQAAFSQLWYVALYLVALVALAFHLWHGFQSAFQSLGLNHSKYTPFIQIFGKAYSILIPLLFALQPIIMYLQG